MSYNAWLWSSATALANKWDMEAAARAEVAAAATLQLAADAAAAAVVSPAIKAVPVAENAVEALTTQQLVDGLTEITGVVCCAVVIEFTQESVAEQAALGLFTKDQDLQSVKMADRFLLLTRKKDKGVQGWKKQIKSSQRRGVEVTAVTLTSLKKSPIQWTTLFNRNISVDMGPPIEGMFRRIQNGRLVIDNGLAKTIVDQHASMITSSDHRGHQFDRLVINLKLEAAWTVKAEEEAVRIFKTHGREPLNTDPILCGCLPNCMDPLHVQGPNKWGDDRLIDPIGYTESEQTIRIISIRHNVPTKHDSVPQQRAEGQGWEAKTSENMVLSTTRRIKQIKNLKRPTAHHQTSIKFYKDNPHLFTRDVYKKILREKKAEDPLCAKLNCRHKLHFGDKKGILRTAKNPRQASPDRLDNDNIFYTKDNFNLVCLGCQPVDYHNGRRDLENEQSDDVVALLYGHIAEIKAILQQRQAKAENAAKKAQEEKGEEDEVDEEV